MKFVYGQCLALCALVACASSTEENPPQQSTLSAACKTPPPARLTPSNLPADICDVAGTKDLAIASGTAVRVNPNDPCDMLIPQGDDLPAICVFKYGTVTIGGALQLIPPKNAPRSPVVAIVATNVFSIPTGGIVDVHGQYIDDPIIGSVGAGASDPRGEAAVESGGGAGHVTQGGGAPGVQGGAAFGPTTGAQLVAGSTGAWGEHFLGFGYGGQPGMGGGAVQLVSCGRFELSGTIDASGSRGFVGGWSATAPVQGGGGGSGGTIVVEALTLTSSNASLLATGGDGGWGGDLSRDPPGPYAAGGAGGAGGKGHSPPGDGKAGEVVEECDELSGQCWYYAGASGGGGGSVGRIVINVPADVSVPAIASDPPASVGVAATH